MLAAFVREADRLFEDVGVDIGVRGGGVGGSTLRTAQRSRTNDYAFDRSAAAESAHFSRSSDGHVYLRREPYPQMTQMVRRGNQTFGFARCEGLTPM